MEEIRLGIIKEGKVPHDFRVPLTPKQCAIVEAQYPEVKIKVQSSTIRCFDDNAYRNEGIEVVDSLRDCNIIIGVKEVNVADLLPNRKFMFFSHTIKKQPYNQKLLRAILDKHIQLIDYELLKDKHGHRIIGFGRYAGIVGCYNGFLALGLKTDLYQIQAANQCNDRKCLEEELKKVVLPNDTRIVLTGWGRVGNGAREIIDLLPIKEVTPEEYLTQNFNEPVFTHLDSEEYYVSKNRGDFDKSDFYANPQNYKAILEKYIAANTTMYIPCHFWNSKSPVLITKEFLQKDSLKLKVVADISCDINGPIASTIRSTKIADPIYGYDPKTGKEVDFKQANAIAVMAVDNLPCELPKDASEDFGNELIKNVFHALFREDVHDIIGRASETDLNGNLMPNFGYLSDYANEPNLAGC